MITILDSQLLSFPPIEQVHSSGIIALGGDLSAERLLLAYNSGIFPWYEDGEPITWWSPDPRMVLFFDNLKVSKSMRTILNRGVFTITENTCFREVITNCQQSVRSGQLGTWITDDIVEAYCDLHARGIAKSVEVWQDDVLVGGLYGIDLGHVFCGESMFSLVSNASKAAFIYLAQKLEEAGYQLLDCQIYNDHLASLGAQEIPRDAFISYLK